MSLTALTGSTANLVATITTDQSAVSGPQDPSQAAKNSGLVFTATGGQLPATTGAVPSTATSAAGDPLIKKLQKAEAFIGKLQQPSSGSQGSTIESVTVTLSAKAQELLSGQGTALPTNDGTGTNGANAPTSIDLAARLQQALDDPQNPVGSALSQLKQLNEQVRQANHDAAGQKLQQLLKQFSILRLFNGSLSPRQLAELAKEIADAAQQLASSDSGPTIDATGSSAGSTTDASSASTALSSNESATTSVIEGSVDTATPAAPAPVATPGAASPAVSASVAGTSSTSGQGHAPAASASAPNVSATDTLTGNTSRQALLNAIEAQGAKGLSEVQGKIADQSLLQQAANAVSAIQGLIKQAQEKEQHKHKGTPDAESDQATKVAGRAGEVIAEAQPNDRSEPEA